MKAITKTTGKSAEYSHLQINHYRGCDNACFYCYGPAVTKNPDFHTKPVARKGILQVVRTEAVKLAGTDDRVLLSFTCDAYQTLDSELQLTREILTILKANNIPFQILTKNGYRAIRDFDLYSPNDMFAETLTFLNDGKSLQAEPKAATPFERIETLKLAHDKKIFTWVSLEPVLDANESLELIRRTADFVQHYKIGILNYHKSTINWRQFGIEAIKLCEALGKTYYIKRELADFLKGVGYTNTDTRKVQRDKGTEAQRADDGRLFG